MFGSLKPALQRKDSGLTYQRQAETEFFMLKAQVTKFSSQKSSNPHKYPLPVFDKNLRDRFKEISTHSRTAVLFALVCQATKVGKCSFPMKDKKLKKDSAGIRSDSTLCNAKKFLSELGILSYLVTGRNRNKVTNYTLHADKIIKLFGFLDAVNYIGTGEHKQQLVAWLMRWLNDELNSEDISILEHESTIVYDKESGFINSNFRSFIRDLIPEKDSLLLTPSNSSNNIYTQPSAQNSELELRVNCTAILPEPEGTRAGEEALGGVNAANIAQHLAESDAAITLEENFEQIWTHQEEKVLQLAQKYGKKGGNAPYFNTSLLPHLKRELLIQIKASKIPLRKLLVRGRDVIAEMVWNLTERVSTGIDARQAILGQLQLLRRNFSAPYSYMLTVKKVQPRRVTPQAERAKSMTHAETLAARKAPNGPRRDERGYSSHPDYDPHGHKPYAAKTDAQTAKGALNHLFNGLAHYEAQKSSAAPAQPIQADDLARRQMLAARKGLPCPGPAPAQTEQSGGLTREEILAARRGGSGPKMQDFTTYGPRRD